MPLAGLKYKKLIGKLQTENYFQTPADVIVFRKGNLAIAIKGGTKETIASSTDHAEVIRKAINSLPSKGGTIVITDVFDIASKIYLPTDNDYILKIKGLGFRRSGFNFTDVDAGIVGQKTSWSWYRQIIFEDLLLTGTVKKMLSLPYENIVWRNIFIEGAMADPDEDFIYVGGSGAPHYPSVIDNLWVRYKGGNGDGSGHFLTFLMEGLNITNMSIHIDGDWTPADYRTPLVAIGGTSCHISRLGYYATPGKSITGTWVRATGPKTTLYIDEVYGEVGVSGYLFDVNDFRKSQIYIGFLSVVESDVRYFAHVDSSLAMFIEYMRARVGDDLKRGPYRRQHGVVSGIPIDSTGVKQYSVSFPIPYPDHPDTRPRIRVWAMLANPTATDFEAMVYVTDVTGKDFTLNVDVKTASATSGATVDVYWFSEFPAETVTEA